MAFPTSNMRLLHRFLRLFTKSFNLNAPHERGRERTPHRQAKFHVLTSVCQADLRDLAGGAQVASPLLTRGFEQATLFKVPSAEIIAVKMGTFLAGRGFHDLVFTFPSK